MRAGSNAEPADTVSGGAARTSNAKYACAAMHGAHGPCESRKEWYGYPVAAGLHHLVGAAQFHARGRGPQSVAGGVQPPHPEPGELGGRAADRPFGVSDPADRGGRALPRRGDRTGQPAGRGARGHRRGAGAQPAALGDLLCLGHDPPAGLVARLERGAATQLQPADRQCARHGIGLHLGRGRPADLFPPGGAAAAAGPVALRLPDAGARADPAVRGARPGRARRTGPAGRHGQAGAVVDVFPQRLFRAPDRCGDRERAGAPARGAPVRSRDVGRAGRYGRAGPGRGLAGGQRAAAPGGPPTSRRWPTAPGTSRYRSWRSRTAATRAPRSRPCGGGWRPALSRRSLPARWPRWCRPRPRRSRLPW